MNKKAIWALAGFLALSACAGDSSSTGNGRTEPVKTETPSASVSDVASSANLSAVTGLKNKRAGKNATWATGIDGLSESAEAGYALKMSERLKKNGSKTGLSVRQDGSVVTLVIPGASAFSTNEYAVRKAFVPTLHEMAKTLNEYDKTYVDIAGYTDDQGKPETNRVLSERRAVSVARILLSQGVPEGRFNIIGRGAEAPVASNRTDEGRAANRRIEIVLTPVVRR